MDCKAKYFTTVPFINRLITKKTYKVKFYVPEGLVKEIQLWYVLESRYSWKDTLVMALDRIKRAHS